MECNNLAVSRFVVGFGKGEDVFGFDVERDVTACEDGAIIFDFQGIGCFFEEGEDFGE